jgi:endonuclease YncB( thermonuclease family)
MRFGRLKKKAPLVGAFFVLGVWLAPVSADRCEPPANTTLVKVRHVQDGDTFVLADDTRVRLIGINTPELGRDDKPAQPLSIRARDRVRQLLFQSGNHAQLLVGQQPKDKYKRQLANLWLPDGRNLTAVLLEAGLGWQVAIPPNVRFFECYAAAESTARQDKKGVWQQTGYHDRPSAGLGLRDTGFQHIKGRVIRVNHGGGATWINLDGRFAIRIPDNSRQWFTQLPDSSWIGRELEVRGWIYQVRGELRVTVEHPAMLNLTSSR